MFQIDKEMKELGIKSIRTYDRLSGYHIITFKTQADLNLYRLVGQELEDEYNVKFRVENYTHRQGQFSLKSKKCGFRNKSKFG